MRWLWMVPLLWPLMGHALELSLPNSARQTVARDTGPDRYSAPVGPWVAGSVPVIVLEGAVQRHAWRIEVPGLTPLQVIAPLRGQLEAAGYDIVLDCDDAACGGFDFRFGIETLPGPHMYVNLQSYHFLTALRDSDGVPDQVVTILSSTSARSAHVQIIQAGRATKRAAVTTNAPAVRAAPVALDDLSGELLGQGHVVLRDLDFGTGTSDLGGGSFDSLSALAAFLQAEPEVRIALVGHTDSVGSLDGNIALSRRRAQSVRARLIAEFGIDAARVEAQGMGYLAPVASNLEEAGREANRRVEAILLSDG